MRIGKKIYNLQERRNKRQSNDAMLDVTMSRSHKLITLA